MTGDGGGTYFFSLSVFPSPGTYLVGNPSLCSRVHDYLSNPRFPSPTTGSCTDISSHHAVCLTRYQETCLPPIIFKEVLFTAGRTHLSYPASTILYVTSYFFFVSTWIMPNSSSGLDLDACHTVLLDLHKINQRDTDKWEQSRKKWEEQSRKKKKWEEPAGNSVLQMHVRHEMTGVKRKQTDHHQVTNDVLLATLSYFVSHDRVSSLHRKAVNLLRPTLCLSMACWHQSARLPPPRVSPFLLMSATGFR